MHIHRTVAIALAAFVGLSCAAPLNIDDRLSPEYREIMENLGPADATLKDCIQQLGGPRMPGVDGATKRQDPPPENPNGEGKPVSPVVLISRKRAVNTKGEPLGNSNAFGFKRPWEKKKREDTDPWNYGENEYNTSLPSGVLPTPQ